MRNATCPRLRLPAVSDYSTKLLLPIPGHRILSPPRLFIGGSTRTRPRTCAFFSGNVEPANNGSPLAATVLTTPPSLGARDSPVMTTEDSRSYLIRICPEPPAPSSSQPSWIARTWTTGTAFPSELYPAHPTPLRDRTPRVSSPRSFKHHPRRPSQSLGDTRQRLPLRSRGPSRLSSLGQPAAPSPSPCDSLTDSRN